MSPTAHCRNGVKPAAEKFSSGTTDICMEQLAQRLLVPHRPWHPQFMRIMFSGSPRYPHLFICPVYSSILSPVHLWTNPVEVAQFLGLDRYAEPPDLKLYRFS